ncbi:MAG: response regulator transcription factor [Bacteroidales bacterium]|nr:response regulator transcription factor [Bacteroidales bacterium]
MKILIIEDEKPAGERLRDLIKIYDPGIEISGIADSIKKSVLWLEKGEKPDLILMDIQLADGLSFEIFEKTIVDAPVIFTTAYNEYALKAFKVNSIDYLLKPIDFDELSNALDKYRRIYPEMRNPIGSHIIDAVTKMLSNRYKQRFAIRIGDRIRSIPVDDVLYFYSLEKATFLHTKDNRDYVIDHSLEQAESLLNPTGFFRINRKYIVSFEAISDIFAWSNSRLKLELKHSSDQEIVVSRERVAEFREWLNR